MEEVVCLSVHGLVGREDSGVLVDGEHSFWLLVHAHPTYTVQVAHIVLLVIVHLGSETQSVELLLFASLSPQPGYFVAITSICYFLRKRN